jgi:hypothetical protein
MVEPPPAVPASEASDAVSRIDPVSAGLAEVLREQIWTGWAASPRSRQTVPGMSEIGAECPRQLAYKVAGVPPVNFSSEPMPSLTGTGMHAELAAIFSRLDGGTGRYLIESPVKLRGDEGIEIPGTVDLYDRRRRIVIDWKTTKAARLRKVRAEGPPGRYLTQIQCYAAALAQTGETPERVAIVYLPHDGSLNDLWAYTAAIDPDVPIQALRRYREILNAVAPGNDPLAVDAQPTRLCGYCPHYSRNASAPNAACCPGVK